MSMPELSRFFGIVVRMYHEAGQPHHQPHFHAKYQHHLAVYGIPPVELFSGSLPVRQRRLVEAWAELHREELLRNWNLLISGQLPDSIEPLR
jgi:hypothetical protein